MKTEHEEQREFVSWFRKKFHPIRIFAIPNGGKRGKAEAAKLKVEGVSAGIPDLYVPEWKLWVEMKVEEGGKVSKDQKDWHKYLQEIGDGVLIARGFKDAKKQTLDFLDNP